MRCLQGGILLNYLEQIEVLREKKRELLKAKVQNQSLLSNYSREYDRLWNLYKDQSFFSSEISEIGEALDEFYNSAEGISIAFLLFTALPFNFSKNSSELAITLGYGALVCAGIFMIESFNYFRFKRKVMKGQIDLYDFDIERYDTRERLDGNCSAIEKMCTQKNKICSDISRVDQQLEAVTKKKTL